MDVLTVLYLHPLAGMGSLPWAPYISPSGVSLALALFLSLTRTDLNRSKSEVIPERLEHLQDLNVCLPREAAAMFKGTRTRVSLRMNERSPLDD